MHMHVSVKCARVSAKPAADPYPTHANSTSVTSSSCTCRPHSKNKAACSLVISHSVLALGYFKVVDKMATARCSTCAATCTAADSVSVKCRKKQLYSGCHMHDHKHAQLQLQGARVNFDSSIALKMMEYFK